MRQFEGFTVHRAAGPSVACPYCGQPVGLGDFVARVDDPRGQVAICGRCGGVVNVGVRQPAPWLSRPQRPRGEDRARAHVFTAGPQCPRAVRTFTRETMSQWRLDATKDSVVLVVNELITAAMTQLVESIVIALGVREHVVRAVVADESTALPFRRQPGPTGPEELSLSVVDSLATEWGTNAPAGGNGLLVWADVAIDEADYPIGGLSSTS
jgi:hypothetical protein